MVSLLFPGCAMHGAWKDARDMLIGTRFDPLKSRNEEAGILYTRRFNIKEGGGFFYRSENEDQNIRYYIQWGQSCHYSLLVSPGGVIISWRYEGVKNPRFDCVTS